MEILQNLQLQKQLLEPITENLENEDNGGIKRRRNPIKRSRELENNKLNTEI